MKTHVPIPIQNSKVLQELQHIISAKLPDSYNLERIIADIKDEQYLEYSWLMLKRAHLDPLLWTGLGYQLKVLAEKIRTKNIRRQQTHAGQLLFRLRFKVTAQAYMNNYAKLQHLLGQTLMDAGLPIAMGLEKIPKLAVKLGCHLPMFTEGHNEWADVILLNPTERLLVDLPTIINSYAPQGIYTLEVIKVYNHASPVADLCHRAHWQWTYNGKLTDHISNKINVFLESKCFYIEKINKADGNCKVTQIDVRPIFENCTWDKHSLKFQTAILPGQAVNPNKILAAILKIATPLSGLVRNRLELKDDPRSFQEDKFNIKLHNMYEDAIVLDTAYPTPSYLRN
jgi:hypothetical protein